MRLRNPGPTAVLFRSNAVKGGVQDDGFPAIHETTRYLAVEKTSPPANAIVAAAGMLAKAERPTIIAGNGIRIAGAFDELRQVAERLGAPVVTSYLGKGTLPETHPLAIGPIGYTGVPLANELVASADVILVVGCRLKPQETCFANPKMIDPNRQTIIQIDVEPRNASWTMPASLALVADAKVSLELLDRQLAQAVAIATAAERSNAIGALKKARSVFAHPKMQSRAVPLYPQRVVAEVNDAVTDDAIICTDAGNNRHWMNHFFRTKRANSYFGTGGIGGVSWSMAATLAAKIIAPDRPAIGVCGDGGFAMQMHVLLSAVQYAVAPIYVVMNNSAFGMTGQGMGNRSVGNALPQTDYASISRSCGCFAEQARKPGEVREIITAAMRQNKPAVVDVVTDADQVMRQELYSPFATEALAGGRAQNY
jgi:acetolactate synthase I/II/III large subunit